MLQLSFFTFSGRTFKQINFNYWFNSTGTVFFSLVCCFTSCLRYLSPHELAW